MRKAILVLGLIIPVFCAAGIPFGVEGGAGLAIQENNNAFFTDGSAILHIYRNFYARTEVASLSFPSGGTIISLGTGQGFDVMMFLPGAGITPYGLSGLYFMSGGGLSTFNLKLGGGAEFKLTGSKMAPFVEATIDILSTSINSHSHSTNVITIKGGIRMR
ncbi:hypothetical protein CH333_08870 [candidate division WOR-3 bacterium JGI_Cruoil_03_44_89]|uniref:Outer membrane protein beta-barrel domain-containing protein n=1 Tax=candidate division WOR-3 bacterium JGI_Cruoil_03_44_89 TaxID=1973748 RepID=A0A235BPB6_UNCW3|nr:MAG: hypothetical protein CH333_08870 [candidate division WOR-3 bacterium JGI_Cruoil_03_44_89]